MYVFGLEHSYPAHTATYQSWGYRLGQGAGYWFPVALQDDSRQSVMETSQKWQNSVSKRLFKQMTFKGCSYFWRLNQAKCVQGCEHPDHSSDPTRPESRLIWWWINRTMLGAIHGHILFKVSNVFLKDLVGNVQATLLSRWHSLILGSLPFCFDSMIRTARRFSTTWSRSNIKCSVTDWDPVWVKVWLLHLHMYTASWDVRAVFFEKIMY